MKHRVFLFFLLFVYVGNTDSVVRFPYENGAVRTRTRATRESTRR